MVTGETLDAVRNLQGLGVVPKGDDARQAWATALAGLTDAQLKAGLRWVAEHHHDGWIRPATFIAQSKGRGPAEQSADEPWYHNYEITTFQDHQHRPIALAEQTTNKRGETVKRPLLERKPERKYDPVATAEAKLRFYHDWPELSARIVQMQAKARQEEQG